MKLPKFGLIFKFAISLSVLIIITSLLLTVFLVMSERIRIASDLKDKGLSIAKNIAYSSERGVLTDDKIFLQQLVSGLKDEKDIIYAQIIDTKGIFLARYYQNSKTTPSVYNIGIPIESFDTATRNGPWVKTKAARVIGEVKLGISLQKVENSTTQIFQVIFRITFVAIIFGILGVYVLIRYFLAVPLEKFVVGTHKVAEGDLTYKINILSDDELGDLAQSFNGMTSDLKKSREEVQAHTDTLDREVKERTKELQESLEKIKMVDRMKTEFLSMVSHELKTPLTPVCEYTSLLIDNILGPLNQKQMDALKTIKRQSTHLDHLIETILDVSRLEMGKPFAIHKEFVSIPVILEDVQEAINMEIQKKAINLEISIQENIPTIFADSGALKRLMLNLIGNSIKFSPHGGRIKVSFTAIDHAIKCCVTDSGIGVAKENLDKIFDKFFQVDSSFTRESGGIGMGLAIAKGIVESHSGKIWAESPGLGYGTMICFTLPLMKD